MELRRRVFQDPYVKVYTQSSEGYFLLIPQEGRFYNSINLTTECFFLYRTVLPGLYSPLSNNFPT